MHRLIYVKNEILPILLAASVEWVTIWNWSELGRKRSKRKAMADKKKRSRGFVHIALMGITESSKFIFTDILHLTIFPQLENIPLKI